MASEYDTVQSNRGDIMRPKRIVLTAALGAAVLAGGAMPWLDVARGSGSAAAGPAPVPVRVATVHLEPAAAAARYAAVIAPRIEASIGFRVAGKMTERLVEVGDRVAAGTPLARLDAADLELQARAAEAERASAAADAANAGRDFARYAELRQGQWTTEQEFDKRKAAMETAAARLRQADAQLQVARDNARYATLMADAPGVVTAVLAEPGQVVAAGQTVVRIARAGTVEAVADLPEQAVGALAGATLGVELWSMPSVAIRGHLRETAPIADGSTRTFRARIALDDPPPGIQLGMTATLVVQPPQAGAVALLPMTALAQRAGAPAMFVVNPAGDGLALRPVTVAAYEGDQVVVASGLADGERVVSAGVQKLDPGLPVRIWTEPAR